MIEFFIPMKKIPTTTHQQKQVTCKNGKPHFFEPPKLLEARAKYMSSLAPFVPKHAFNGPVHLTVKWIFPMVKGSRNGQYKHTKPDTDNLQKLLKDCMTELGFWKDDALVASELA